LFFCCQFILAAGQRNCRSRNSDVSKNIPNFYRPCAFFWNSHAFR